MTKNMVDFVAIDVHENLNPLAVFAIVLFTHFSISDLFADDTDADLGIGALCSRLCNRLFRLLCLGARNRALLTVGTTRFP